MDQSTVISPRAARLETVEDINAEGSTAGLRAIVDAIKTASIYGRVLDRSTTLLNERTSLIFGSRDTVEKIERLHALPESFSDTAPLFGSRGLFRD